MADALESIGDKMARSASGYVDLDKDDLRVLLDEVRNMPMWLARERALGRQQGFDEARSLVEMNLPMGLSATIRKLFSQDPEAQRLKPA